MSHLHRRLTYANVVSTLCLFILLGGSAYAAATIGSAQVVDNSLQSADLRDNAGVRARDLVNDNVAGGGLSGADIRESDLRFFVVPGTSLMSSDVCNEQADAGRVLIRSDESQHGGRGGTLYVCEKYYDATTTGYRFDLYEAPLKPTGS